MSRVFHQCTALEIVELINHFPFQRQINRIQLYSGHEAAAANVSALELMQGMWLEHVQLLGLADVACHMSVASEGEIWLGRNLNWPPASVTAEHEAACIGTLEAGAFVMCLSGRTQVPGEQTHSAQLLSALSVIKAIQMKFSLGVEHIFVNQIQNDSDSSIGDSHELWRSAAQEFTLPSPSQQRTNVPFRVRASRAHELIKAMKPDLIPSQDTFNRENLSHDDSDTLTEARAMNSSESINDDMLDDLTRHVINLERGKFSRSGRIETGKGDVDRLFDELLPAEIALRKQSDEKAKVVFYAHGGLVSEKNALINAHQQLSFWRANNIYPIFFIWETGFAETLRQLVKESVTRSGREDSARGITDISDALIEELARASGGKLVWGAMQSSAELSSAKGSGGAYVVAKLRELVKEHGAHLEIHAVGHSAGSIFHTHFLKALSGKQIATKTVSFLAPAVTTRLFLKKLAPLLGKTVGPVTIFTMNKNRERKDTVTSVYRKSLLYLVYEALESKRRTNLLGLEVSLRNDDSLRSIFGLRGKTSDKGEIVFSPSEDTESAKGSQALTHGGFDNDSATMDSVLRRILRKTRGEPIQSYAASASRSMEDFWMDQFEWPPGMEDLAGLAQSTGKTSTAVADSDDARVNVKQTASQSTPQDDVEPPAQRRNRALCIGIDTYKRQPLQCCVKDAKNWNKALKKLGYETMPPLLNAAATGDAIRARMTDLVRSCQPGDHVVLQYAGHGTQIQDVSGDETDGGQLLGKNDEGSRDGMDECLCAIDCDDSDNGLVLDDEIRIIINQLPKGASITCFFDCCHSGSMSRAAPPAQGDARARMLKPSETMLKAYQHRRSALPSSRGATQQQRGVVFSACKDSELAWESEGQGDFTRHSLAIIAEGVGTHSNMDFNNEVVARFGSPRRQTPQIDAAEQAYKHPFMNIETETV